MNQGSSQPGGRAGKPMLPQHDTPDRHDAGHERTMSYLAERIKSIRFGSVEVVIHDGKIVQIETREKRRLDTP